MFLLVSVLLRCFCYIVEALLSLAALAFSVIVLASPHAEIRLGWLPWTGVTLGLVLAGFGVVGILVLVLAAGGRARLLLTLFALCGLVVVTRGLFFSAWRFTGVEQARDAALLVLGLFLAFLGSIPARRRHEFEFRDRVR